MKGGIASYCNVVRNAITSRISRLLSTAPIGGMLEGASWRSAMVGNVARFVFLGGYDQVCVGFGV